MFHTEKRRKLDLKFSDSNLRSPVFGSSPTIFVAQGIKPDVRIDVFGIEEFHVHSTILKLHSRFFYKFLDSPEKSGKPVSQLFRYDYMAVEDPDGYWGLEPLGYAARNFDSSLKPSSSSGNTTPERMTEEKLLEIRCFKKLLCAMYNRPYRIDTPSELLAITRLADFYIALPIVSATLTDALVNSELFSLKSHESTGYVTQLEMLLCAHKLRHTLLFKDLLILTVPEFNDFMERGEQIFARIEETSTLMALVQNLILQLVEKVARFNNALLTWIIRYPEVSGVLRNRYVNLLGHGRPYQTAAFFRALVQDPTMREDIVREPGLMEQLTSLLKNNLTFDTTGLNSGENIFMYSLLCTEVDDCDLPWDPEEVDW
ncbi:hypothetical protein PVAG01_08278 [Phlyctema vagabunda]|uniref:BTB domain-containing protein n=1 Tax=Phlyctema vagabunda TaxID=108571 RepID=A0ABR4P906_9HELO